jgi:hypothetical protein
MKYKFEQFNVEIENPTITVINVIDNIIDKNVQLKLN